MMGEEEWGTEVTGNTTCVSPWWEGQRASPGTAQGPGG